MVRLSTTRGLAVAIGLVVVGAVALLALRALDSAPDPILAEWTSGDLAIRLLYYSRSVVVLEVAVPDVYAHGNTVPVGVFRKQSYAVVGPDEMESATRRPKQQSWRVTVADQLWPYAPGGPDNYKRMRFMFKVIDPKPRLVDHTGFDERLYDGKINMEIHCLLVDSETGRGAGGWNTFEIGGRRLQDIVINMDSNAGNCPALSVYSFLRTDDGTVQVYRDEFTFAILED